jgi:hypothetical protein
MRETARVTAIVIAVALDITALAAGIVLTIAEGDERYLAITVAAGVAVFIAALRYHQRIVRLETAALARGAIRERAYQQAMRRRTAYQPRLIALPNFYCTNTRRRVA